MKSSLGPGGLPHSALKHPRHYSPFVPFSSSEMGLFPPCHVRSRLGDHDLTQTTTSELHGGGTREPDTLPHLAARFKLARGKGIVKTPSPVLRLAPPLSLCPTPITPASSSCPWHWSDLSSWHQGSGHQMAPADGFLCLAFQIPLPSTPPSLPHLP